MPEMKKEMWKGEKIKFVTDEVDIGIKCAKIGVIAATPAILYLAYKTVNCINGSFELENQLFDSAAKAAADLASTVAVLVSSYAAVAAACHYAGGYVIHPVIEITRLAFNNPKELKRLVDEAYIVYSERISKTK